MNDSDLLNIELRHLHDPDVERLIRYTKDIRALVQGMHFDKDEPSERFCNEFYQLKRMMRA